MYKLKKISLLLVTCLICMMTKAEDGSQLWLRYKNVTEIQRGAFSIRSNAKGNIVEKAKKELNSYWQEGNVHLMLNKELRQLKDGYQLRRNGKETEIIAGREIGLLYGTYHLLRLQTMGVDFARLKIEEIPDFDVRMLNHWDNLDGTIERGYAGHSLWKWEDLPLKISPRYEAYARANASIGINAVVLNNVNASPEILRPTYLKKVKALADIFRTYGIKVFLSVNFSSPKVIGGTMNADPLNPTVISWWKHSVKEIYQLIPDFGGFLVKANSEGQPGPQDYGRTHVDGANMLADVLKQYGGLVMWRAFVYNPSKEDRAKQAFQEFVPLDGAFRDNVIIQIKNGPIDFQPREPFNPLFGALKKTPQMVEFQITQEYLGFSNHLVYLAPLFKETLESDTYAYGKGSTIARLTDGSLGKGKLSAIAGVANIGEDTNWCGHHFAQANWYAFGRLAWKHSLTAADIAQEWVSATFTNEESTKSALVNMMLDSREAVVNYMMPLGLHHIFAFDHHYGPEPWGDRPGGRPDWMPWYYHNADSLGIGFDRSETGSNAVGQYFSPLDSIYGNFETCPKELLLWFHHVPWDYQMDNAKSLWENLCYAYDAGVRQVRNYQKIWDRLEEKVDKQRFLQVQSKLRIQARDAVWWKDACLLYFQTFSRKAIPYELERPVHDLEELKSIKLKMTHHN